MEPVSALQFGAVTLVPDERLVLKDGEAVPLTPKAFDLLVVLATNPGRLLAKEQLMQAVWPDTAVEESNLSYHVFAIRKAIGDSGEGPPLIETVPKRGYRFTAPVVRVAHGSGGLIASGTQVGEAAQDTLPKTVASSRPMAESGRRSAATSRMARPVVWFLAGALFASAAMLLLLPLQSEAPTPLIRAQIAPGVRLSAASPFALSPDGQQLAFAGSGTDGVTRLWLQQVGQERARPLAGTETVLGGLVPPMFWSPDSNSVAFDAVGQLKRYDVREGIIRTVCGIPGLAVGGSWNAAGIVLLGQPGGGLLRCSVSDGQVSTVTRLDAAKGETAHLFPWFLPDGLHFLYVKVARGAPEHSGVYLGSLDTSAEPPRERLLGTGFGTIYVPRPGSSRGHVVFLRAAMLFAQAFDERTLTLVGEPISLASPVGSFLDGGFFTAAQADVIAFRPPDKDFQLTWFDRQGKQVGTVGEVGRYSGMTISRDGSRVAVARELVGANPSQDIWILPVDGTAATPVTFGPQLEDMPVWSADSRRLIFTVGGEAGTLFEHPVGGPAPHQLIEKNAQHKIPTSVSRDGRFALFTAENTAPARGDIWVLPLTTGAKAFPLIQRNLDQEQGQFSPDGLWVAYASNESGRYEIFVRRFSDSSAARPSEPTTRPISTSGGTAPRWRADGKELYFIAPDGSVMASDVQTGANLSVAPPRPLFRLPGSHGDWDVVSDGSRFLIAIPAGADASAPFTLLWNRLASLPR